MQPSPEWDVLCEPFRSLFTRPSFRIFSAFVFTLAHLDHRLWVTQVALSGLVNRHFTCFYRFLRLGAWSCEAVSRQMWLECLPLCTDEHGRAFVAGDDTVCQKSGTHFQAASWHHDPMNRQSAKHLSFGHCFVCVAALARQSGNHYVSLFVSCALYVQEKVCAATGRAFVTKLELAARLFEHLPVPEGVTVIATADGAYAKSPFVQGVLATGKHVLSRLRNDTVFYEMPAVSLKKKRGRPVKYGPKHKAREWATDPMTPWQSAQMTLYGHQTLVQFATRVALQRTLDCQIRLVAVRWANRPTVFLFCTDTTMSAQQTIEAYCARFAIETGFRDSKQHFGLATYQVRGETSIVKLVHLCLWAQTLLRLLYWDKKPGDSYGQWRKPLEYLTLAQQKKQSLRQSRINDTSTKTRTNPIKSLPSSTPDTVGQP